ncbi:interleukin-21 receptor isoform X2 [Struthio camelus]|uniref:interleukin-21 receptor isoform X2 n=1 Tax=Struthio camelus TaxID=8801 RepID=UPI003604118F
MPLKLDALLLGHPARTNMRNKQWTQSIFFFLLFQCTTYCENLTCFVDYVQTLSCILKNDLGAGSYNLTATWISEEDPENTVATCSLLQSTRNTSHTQYVCTVDMTELLADIKVQVDVTEIADSHHVISKGFYMGQNIKPQPPFNLTAVFSEGYNISWETIYQNSPFHFLNEELEYQLRYKRRNDTWETQKTKAVHEDKRTLVILPRELQGNTEYEFQVRARLREDTGYHGFWSEWSPPLTLKTSPAGTQRAGTGWLLLFGVVAMITASVTAFLAKQQSLWKKMTCIPDPAPFFKPLYLVHNGDFKTLWERDTSWALMIFMYFPTAAWLMFAIGLNSKSWMGTMQTAAWSHCLTSCLSSPFRPIRASHICTRGLLVPPCEADGTGCSQGKVPESDGLSLGIPESCGLVLVVKWVGASRTKMTLDFFEWGIVLPEVLEVYSMRHPKSTSQEELSELKKDPPCKPCVSCLTAPGQDSQSLLSSVNSSTGTQDQSYGHLSIDTVTVADEFTPCNSHCNCNRVHSRREHASDEDGSAGETGYPKVNIDDDERERSCNLLLADLSTQDKILASGSVSTDHLRSASAPAHQQVERALERGMGSILEALCLHPDQWDLENLASLPSPDGESVSYSEGSCDFFPQSARPGDSYPMICLDLDTIDSGFVDSDCGSPVDCEFDQNSQTNCGSIPLEQEGEDFPRSYVKQWVSCRSDSPANGTQTN